MYYGVPWHPIYRVLFLGAFYCLLVFAKTFVPLYSISVQRFFYKFRNRIEKINIPLQRNNIIVAV